MNNKEKTLYALKHGYTFIHVKTNESILMTQYGEILSDIHGSVAKYPDYRLWSISQLDEFWNNLIIDHNAIKNNINYAKTYEKMYMHVVSGLIANNKAYPLNPYNEDARDITVAAICLMANDLVKY